MPAGAAGGQRAGEPLLLRPHSGHLRVGGSGALSHIDLMTVTGTASLPTGKLGQHSAVQQPCTQWGLVVAAGDSSHMAWLTAAAPVRTGSETASVFAVQPGQPCGGERLLLMFDRWRKLGKAFYSEKRGQFDISKVRAASADMRPPRLCDSHASVAVSPDCAGGVLACCEFVQSVSAVDVHDGAERPDFLLAVVSLFRIADQARSAAVQSRFSAQSITSLLHRQALIWSSLNSLQCF